MPFELFQYKRTQDAEEGGAPIGVIDLGDRTLQIGTKLPIHTLAAAYTFVAEDSGTFFKCTAALTFTLPSASAAFKGCHCWIYVAADVTVTIAGTAGELTTFNDIAANSVAFSTSSEKVGACIHALCDGVTWMIIVQAEETQTMTVTT